MSTMNLALLALTAVFAVLYVIRRRTRLRNED
jgi:hypothetical protein